MHVVYPFFSDLPTTTRMHIHIPGQYSHQECHQCIHAGVYKRQLLRYDDRPIVDSVLHDCCVIVWNIKIWSWKNVYVFFTSGCAARGDRHGHLEDSSEENSRRKVSQVRLLCNDYSSIWVLGKQLLKEQLPALRSISTHTLIHTCTHTWLKQTPRVPSSERAQWGPPVPDCRGISGRWFPSPPRIWPCGLWGCETKVIEGE